MITGWVPEDVVTEIRTADVAARAVRAVPGVVRLQPGVWGLLARFAAEAFEQATGHAVPDVAGVRVELDGAPVRVDVQIVVDGGHRAADVGVAVQEAVVAAVPRAVGLRVAAVAVHVVDVELP